MTVDEYNNKAHDGSTERSSSQSSTILLGKKSPGVERIEVIAQHITVANRIFIFIGVFLIAYAYGLDGTLRYAYQVYSHLKFIIDGANSFLAYGNVQLRNPLDSGYIKHRSCCYRCCCTGMLSGPAIVPWLTIHSPLQPKLQTSSAESSSSSSQSSSML